MKQESKKHNTHKDQKFNKKKFTRNNSSKVEREGKEVADTAYKEESKLVGGRSCLRESSDNDPEWYAQDPQLLKDAFNLPMANRLGNQLTIQIPKDGTTVFPYLGKTNWSVPGVYSLKLAPVPGISTDATSAVNVAAKKLFTYIRHANSGAANYQAPDLMMYMLAMDNCYALWNWLVRMYGVARVYSTRNAYLPAGLLYTMNVDIDDIQANLNTLRTIINQFGSKLSTMKVPSHLSYFKRHAWLFSNVFADSDTAKAQTYIYNPSILYQWSETTTSGQLPYLEPIAITDDSLSSKWKMDGISALVNSFINPIFYSEDFNIMSGDILKAYGAENCYTIPSIQEDYAVIPVHNYEVAMQFENARIPGGAVKPTGQSWRITQSNEEALIFNPTVAINRADLIDDFIYNFHTDEVSPEQVAVATRLNLLVNSADAGFKADQITGTAGLISCGSEIVTAAYSIHAYGMTSSGQYNWNPIQIRSNIVFTSATATNMIQAVCSSSQFDWSPLISVFYSTGVSGADNEFQGISGDLDNYTVIDAGVLSRMNDVALLSMFGIPGSAGV